MPRPNDTRPPDAAPELPPSTARMVAAEIDQHTVRALIQRWSKYMFSGVPMFRVLLREYALLAANNAREILHQQQIIEQQEREIALLREELTETTDDLLLMKMESQSVYDRVARVTAHIQQLARM